jgi:LysR family glycine cleavage system transcriptional activator
MAPHRRRPLPPLNWLRAFESAARHLSFTAAADELGVTQAAVSQQVRQLEELLGTPLFKRLARGLALTDAGLAYLPALRDGFERIGRETEAVFGRLGTRPVTLRAPPTLAALWLGRRLAALRARRPDLAFRVTTMWAPVDFAQEAVDIEIRYGAGDWPGLGAVKLFDETYFPVAAPGVAARAGVSAPADLARLPLIHVLGEREGWGDYAQALGLAPFPAEGLQCDSLVVALDAAAAGAGIALATSPVADAMLGDGCLAPLFAERLKARGAHHAVLPAGSATAAVEDVLATLVSAERKGIAP